MKEIKKENSELLRKIENLEQIFVQSPTKVTTISSNLLNKDIEKSPIQSKMTVGETNGSHKRLLIQSDSAIDLRSDTLSDD